MATLIALEQSAQLFKLDVELDADEQIWRQIYLSPRLQTWLETTLPTLTSDWDIDVDPLGQFDDLAWSMVSGKPMTFEWSFKPLTHMFDGVWALKTADLRIFGWFNAMDCFVGVVADTATRIKTHHLYRGYIDEVIRFRNDLDLDEPKFIPGRDPHGVLSDIDFPA